MRTNAFVATALAALFLVGCSTQPDPASTNATAGHSALGADHAALEVQRGPIIQTADRGESAPLWLVPAASTPTSRYERGPLPVPKSSLRAPTSEQPEPLAPSFLSMPALINSWDAVGNGFVGPAGTFTVTVAPPDTNGDVGPNHYISTVNSDFAIFNKAGTALFGPVQINT